MVWRGLSTKPATGLRQAEQSADRTGAPPPDWKSSLLERLLRISNAGPRAFYRLAVASLGLTSVLALVLSAAVRPARAAALPWPQRDMIAVSLAALCLSAALGLASLARRRRTRRERPRHTAWVDRIAAPQQRAVIWLALAAWIPFLLIVVYYRARATFPPAVKWLYYGFHDERWVTACFLLGALAPMIWLAVAARVLAVGRSRPPTWRAWAVRLVADGSALASGQQDAAGEPTGPRRSRGRRILPVAAGLATALGLAWYFLGPPWYLTENGAPVRVEEVLWLTGLQAIAKGHLPYIGAAQIQYGPGTQFLSYLIMRHVTSFSVVGFRQAWALYQWSGASILFAVFFLAFGYARGLAVSLLSALVFPILRQFAFLPGGSFDGYFGWANPLRYAGMIALVLLLPAVVRRCPSWWGAAAGGGLGVLWGITSYLAQENLIGGAAGALAVAALLLLTGTASWPAVRTALAAALAGALLIWLPVLAFYAVHRDLGQFLRLYFLLPRALARGFGNTPWRHAGTYFRMPFSLGAMFYALPFLLAVGGLLTVVEVRPVRIAAGWSRERTRLAVTVIVTILVYQGVLLRSDIDDMLGTVLMVPALAVMTATAVPRLLGGRRRVTLTAAGAALAAASFLLVPGPLFTWTSVRSFAVAPFADRQRMAAAPRPGAPDTLAARRLGAGLAGTARCCGQPPVPTPTAEVVSVMNRLHAIIGSRTTYVVNFPLDFPLGQPGLAYFLADLTPAPIPADKYNTIINEPQLRAYMAYFRANVVPRTQALVTDNLGSQEAVFFLQRYPHARRISVRTGSLAFTILLAPGRIRGEGTGGGGLPGVRLIRP